jgi:DNA-binding transcriptional MerR regulator
VRQKVRFLNAGEAARQLGVSAKALRLYEKFGLIVPDRSRAGWRSYGPAHMARAEEIVSLRKLGLGLAEISALLATPPASRENVLAAHQSHLESQLRELSGRLRAVGEKRSSHRPARGGQEEISFGLPWPWNGERLVAPATEPLTYITGPLGSGKTRLALRLSERLHGGSFLGLDRFDDASHPARSPADEGRRSGTQQVLDALETEGATMSSALTILVMALCSGDGPLVVDMIEQGLDHKTQMVFVAYLRRRKKPARPLFLMTRSSAILDLSIAESGETIIYCPANHGPPMIVYPDPLRPGYEAVASCLASPEVRARTAGVIAILPVETRPSRGDSRETIS